MPEFFREQSEAEKKDFEDILIRKEDVIDRFKKDILKKEAEYVKKACPYCARCAKIDFFDHVETTLTEHYRKVGKYATSAGELDIKLPDLEQYGKAERFELIKESDAMEPLPMAQNTNIQRQIKIGIHRDYKCLVRGCGISLFRSNDQIQEEMSNLQNNEPKEVKSK